MSADQQAQSGNSAAAELVAALRAAVESGVQTLCRNCLHGVTKTRWDTWVHGPGGWEGTRCPRRLTGAEPFELSDLLALIESHPGRRPESAGGDAE